MVQLSRGTFRCVLLTPGGKLLDCKAGALVLPAHDGLRGVLRNHAPMLCKLETGIIEVRQITGREDAFFLIDGGFVRISENFVTILAHEVTTFEGMEPDEAEAIVSKARSIVVGGAYIRRQIGQVDLERAKQLVKLARLSSIMIDK
ncbi:MAG: F0F1 ATP synthase subunit epsilon [Planctomycetota bacterium]